MWMIVRDDELAGGVTQGMTQNVFDTDGARGDAASKQYLKINEI